MKRLLFVYFLLFSTVHVLAANVYFDAPTNNSNYYINKTDGRVGVDYHIMTVSSYFVCDWYGARVQHPDGSWDLYQNGQSGGWVFSQTGRYTIEGAVHVVEDLKGNTNYYIYSNYIYINVVDTNHYAITSASIIGPTTINLNQNYTWNAEASPSNVYTPLSYQWWYENLGGASPSSSLSISPDLPGTGTWYKIGTNSSSLTTSFSENSAIYCVVTDGQGNSATSNTLTLTVTLSRIAKNDNTSTANIGLVNEGANIGSQLEEETIPTRYSLSDNYPNPFNPSTTIHYAMPKDGFVTLKVYDILGNVVKTLVNQYQTKGRYDINFNAVNLASGIYFYRLQSGNFISTKKMLLLK